MTNTSVVLLTLFSFVSNNRTTAPESPLLDQYDNKSSIVIDSIENPAYEGHYIYLYLPKSNCTIPYKTIFFCHGIGASNPIYYNALLEHIASSGYAVIYSTYPGYFLFPKKSYRILWNGFQRGVREWKEYLDLSQIGFVGHSYGASAIPSLSLKAIKLKRWGKKNIFLYMMAPWYINQLSNRQLKRFPQHVKVVTEVFQDDRINDPQIAREFYSAIRAPDTNKVFITLQNKDNYFTVTADHDVPLGESDESISVNDYDYCGVHFVFDAISSYTFNHNESIKKTMFSTHGDSTIIVKGNQGECSMTLSKRPHQENIDHRCINFWDHPMNPRNELGFLGTPLRQIILTPVSVVNYGLLLLLR